VILVYLFRVIHTSVDLRHIILREAN
jgi:hypothetical protein